MFAILEKRIVAGVVATLSLLADIAVFVFLGMVSAIILTTISVTNSRMIRDQN